MAVAPRQAGTRDSIGSFRHLSVGGSKAAARWSLESGGEYYGVGAGVGISGCKGIGNIGGGPFGGIILTLLVGVIKNMTRKQ